MQLFVSLLWGGIATAVAAMVAFGMSIAIVWAFILGDDPWPPWSWGLISVATLLAAAVAGLSTGTGVWAYLQRARAASTSAAVRQAWMLLFLGLGAMTMLIAWMAHEA